MAKKLDSQVDASKDPRLVRTIRKMLDTPPKPKRKPPPRPQKKKPGLTPHQAPDRVFTCLKRQEASYITNDVPFFKYIIALFLAIFGPERGFPRAMFTLTKQYETRISEPIGRR